MDFGERAAVPRLEDNILVYETYKVCKKYITDKVILDIGCGNGIQEPFLAETARHVHAVDIDRTVVEENQRKNSLENVTFHCMSGDDLCFATGTFDVVISSQSIEHIFDDEKFLRSVVRVAKDDGIFICVTPNKLSFVPDGEKIYDTPFYPFHFREYYPDQFFNLLRKYFHKVEEMCFHDSSGLSNEIRNSARYRLLYRMSRFALIRWLGRNIPLSLKQLPLRVLVTGTDGSRGKDDLKGTATFMNYADELLPANICGICRKPRRDFSSS